MTHPLLYEINTRCWLRLLSEQQGRGVTLADVPDSEFHRWQQLGFTHIWLMGVWTTGPRCREHALHSRSLRQTLDRILPGWTPDDVPGSPYAIAAYEVPSRLGGEGGLNTFREKLNSMGMKLLLDFVPNHVGLDFPWVTHEPELLIYSLEKKHGTFLQQTDAGPRWLAHGRDPNFPPWVDTVQINYSRPEARAKMLGLLQSVASRCDGVRCDMAMLLLNEVFAKTWAGFVDAGAVPRTEFWADAISAMKKAHPDFLFLAEAYWNLETRLQSLGFDYTYDKRIYDHILDHHHKELQSRVLDSPPGSVAKGAHFLENHDEKRIATVLTPAEHRAAALLILGLPGMRFLYEGELDGWRIQVPVHVARWPKEPTDAQIHGMYKELLGAIKESAVGHGEYRLLRPEEVDGRDNAKHFVVVQWQKAAKELDVVAVNLDSHGGQCRVHLAVQGLARHDWIIHDALGGSGKRQCHGGDLEAQGVLLDLPGNGAQLLHFQVV